MKTGPRARGLHQVADRGLPGRSILDAYAAAHPDCSLTQTGWDQPRSHLGRGWLPPTRACPMGQVTRLSASGSVRCGAG
ncbi:hypothetical protein GCM10010361_14700 [Streptomyces olivaceiscleroticus]|uniref:Uncharacterized protein n=1 Tax=Streptomyces olivaceiscleroticus TaxID=68245 RepID=A0ABN0ZL69_9ACTN